MSVENDFIVLASVWLSWLHRIKALPLIIIRYTYVTTFKELQILDIIEISNFRYKLYMTDFKPKILSHMH